MDDTRIVWCVMNERQALSLARAMELDDSFPDNVCPGCQQKIAGWWKYEAHRLPMPDARSRETLAKRRYRGDLTPWPFQGQRAGPCEQCPWSRDYLLARAHRRRYIARYQTKAS